MKKFELAKVLMMAALVVSAAGSLASSATAMSLGEMHAPDHIAGANIVDTSIKQRHRGPASLSGAEGDCPFKAISRQLARSSSDATRGSRLGKPSQASRGM